ncbi:hypothetical protein CYLTODRAFT_408925 [Cylindrobasidium torrendii FP15055 ss-10]|uniref:Uncharacterized protein n=1 Tax=Cylindrobasidium torrendii FP15055 ss-10 TaxID=1314674 RepID=A0A0D7BJN2_9AGAR|nr:hypothetical protein CYLTODRAFT_408925 [Cylindrobasidium torrendii FP15055 ss-10]
MLSDKALGDMEDYVNEEDELRDETSDYYTCDFGEPAKEDLIEGLVEFIVHYIVTMATGVESVVPGSFDEAALEKVSVVVNEIMLSHLFTPLTFIHWIYYIHALSCVYKEHGAVFKSFTCVQSTDEAGLYQIICVCFVVACEAVSEKHGIKNKELSCEDIYIIAGIPYSETAEASFEKRCELLRFVVSDGYEWLENERRSRFLDQVWEWCGERAMFGPMVHVWLSDSEVQVVKVPTALCAMLCHTSEQTYMRMVPLGSMDVGDLTRVREENLEVLFTTLP